jgi:hypothetical protein
MITKILVDDKNNPGKQMLESAQELIKKLRRV